MISIKAQIRKEALQKRRSMTLIDRKIASQAIAEKIFSISNYINARNIFCYVSMPDEVHTGEIIRRALQDGKKVFVPYILENSENEMVATELKSLEDLVVGKYNILTAPKYEGSLSIIPPQELDFIIVPGVAFDEEGHRIGMGGGFYDKFLKNVTSTISVGIAYKCQIYYQLPAEVHDKKVDIVLSI